MNRKIAQKSNRGGEGPFCRNWWISVGLSNMTVIQSREQRERPRDNREDEANHGIRPQRQGQVIKSTMRKKEEVFT